MSTRNKTKETNIQKTNTKTNTQKTNTLAIDDKKLNDRNSKMM